MVEEIAPTKLIMKVSAKALADLDTFSKSDPKVTLLQFQQNAWSPVEGCQTEVINDNLNPTFETPIVFMATNLQLKVRFIVEDDDGALSSDEIGHADTTIETLLNLAYDEKSFEAVLAYDAEPGRKNGSITVQCRVEEQ